MKKEEKIATAQFKNVPTRRAEIVMRFDVPEADATEDYLNAIVGSVRKELKEAEEFANMTTEVEGNWL